MNKAKKNGSVHGSLIEKELPLYSSLKFIRPLRNTRKRHWTFRDYSFKPGIYAILDLREKRVTRVAKVSHCLYKAAIKYLEKRIEGNKNLRIAFLLPSKEVNLPVWLEETANAIKKELLKIPKDKTCKKLKAHIKSRKKEKILSLLDFKPPFTGELTEDGRRIRTYKDGFMGRGGCYVILRDNIVYLIGMSKKQLADRMYRHFYPTYGHHSIIEFSSELETNKFEVALIEIPSLGKKEKDFFREIIELEKFLINEFDPPGNKRKPKQDIPVIPSDLEPWMIPTPDEDLPF